MTDTPRLSLPVIEAAQAQKHVTHNEALVLLDALTQLAVESRTLTAPPGSPADGACYIPATGATGAWSGWDGADRALQRRRLASASCRCPGLKAWVQGDERLTVTYEDGVWRDGIALTAHGGRVTLRAKEEELTLTGAYVETADAAFIPDRAVVLGVAARTTLAITGATSYGVGVGGNTTQFGNLLGIALGSTNVGVIGPAGFYADTKVRVTANGGNFTAGKVRLIVYFLEMSAPTRLSAASTRSELHAARHRNRTDHRDPRRRLDLAVRARRRQRRADRSDRLRLRRRGDQMARRRAAARRSTMAGSRSMRRPAQSRSRSRAPTRRRCPTASARAPCCRSSTRSIANPRCSSFRFG